MSEITTRRMDDTLAVQLHGSVSSANAPQVEAELMTAIQENACPQLVMDLEDLTYISSAGLRVLLRARKQFPKLTLFNVCPEVYEILEMTGFTEMIKVIKAFRRLSVDGCEVIGQGANGKVYRLDADTVVKVYYNPDALPEIKRERELARKAFILGIPTAIPYDVARVGNGYGSVFELLNAKSFGQLMQEEPENVDHYIALSVELLKLIHSTQTESGAMPDMKAVVLDWANFLKDYLPEAESEKLIALVQAVPERNTVIHGDYHVKNVVLQNGEVLLIDMDTLSLGHPVFELASVFNAYVGFYELVDQEVNPFLNLSTKVCRRIWEETIRQYLGSDDEQLCASVKEKAMIVGYARMMRRSIRRGGLQTEDGKRFISHCKARLIELLARTDSLTF